MPQDRLSPPTGENHLALTTLGGASLRLGAGPEVCGPGKPLALVTYLACSPRQTASREHLLDLLWADLEPERARHALRQLLYFLRQSLGSEAIIGAGGDLTLVRALDFDRTAFLAAVERGDAEGAIRLYRGDFLAGFASPGGAEFEHWADLERDRLRTAFLRTAESQVRAWQREGRPREAQQLARRVRDTAPRHESGWRLLLETLAASGDTLALTLETSALVEWLRTEDREPEPSTAKLLQRLTAATAPEPADRSSDLVSELVGRETEFAALLLAWESAREQRMVHCHLSGAAGLGKSRLLLEVRRRFRGLGVPVVALRATPGERQIACGFLAELIRAVCERPGTAAISPAAAATLVAVSPAISSRFHVQPDAATGEEALRHRTAALAELLRVASEEAPFALLLDDLHWLDPASRRVLGACLERLEETRLLVVTAARPGLPLLAEAASQRFDLPPLTIAEVGQLIAALGALPDAPWAGSLADAVHRASAGVPLLVLESLRLAAEEGVLLLDEAGWRCADPARLAQRLAAGSALRARIAGSDREERWLLLLLATVGMPLNAAELTAASGRARSVVEGCLSTLEQRGLVTRLGEQWTAAHDEIAQVAIDVAGAEALPAAHAGLGMMLAARAIPDRTSLLQAGRHFVAAGAEGHLREVFGRYLLLARRGGDERRSAVLAGELAGEAAAPAVIRGLLHGLPLWSRIRLSSARRAVAAGLVLALVAATVAPTLLRPLEPDAVVLFAEAIKQPDATAIPVPLTAAGWQSGVEIDARSVPVVSLPDRSRSNISYAISPDGTRWLLGREHNDSTTYDIYLLDPQGEERRLTWFRHDDGEPSWAPDGRAFVFFTSRWSPATADNFDLAVYDLEADSVRRLTSGRGLDRDGVYSPDGTRIGFHRIFDEEEPAFCVLPQSGGVEPDCLRLPGYVVLGFPGWLDNRFILLLADVAGVHVLVRFDLDTRAAVLLERHVLTAALSPDRRWIAWRSDDSESGESRWRIAPADDIGRQRTLRLPGEADAYIPVWGRHRMGGPGSDAARYLAAVRILAPERPRPASSYQFRVRGFDQHDAPLPVPDTRHWGSSDSTVIRVDAQGVARTLREGRAWVTVDVAGLRRDSIQLTVASAKESFLLRESWAGGVRDNWIPFGDPSPLLVTSRDGRRAFLNNGDGSYPSGAFTRSHWPARGGLGVEADVSVALTKGQWQVALLDLVGGLDSALAGNWDFRSEGMPNTSALPRQTCGLGYPDGEGALGKRRLSTGAGTSVGHIPVDPAIGDGRWMRFRVQLFEDGRCGVALDGRPVWRSRRAIDLGGAFAVRIGYASSETQVLHGPITVWQGVRDDVQWELLDDPEYAP